MNDVIVDDVYDSTRNNLYEYTYKDHQTPNNCTSPIWDYFDRKEVTMKHKSDLTEVQVNTKLFCNECESYFFINHRQRQC